MPMICQSPDDLKVVKALPGFILEVEFLDKTSGKIFMKDKIFGSNSGVFSVLKDPQLFEKVFIQYGVATWPGELDLSPELMYSAIN
jgi:hypothetical protein